jgi:hypothetical protein
MDFANILGDSAPPVAPGLHREAMAASYHAPTTLDRVEDKLSVVKDVAVAGAGLAVGLVARMPGEFGVVGKVAAAGLGGLAVYDVFSRAAGASKDGNKQAYVRDGAFLTALTAGLLLGPRLFASEAAPMTRKLSTSLAEDLTKQGEVLGKGLATKTPLSLETPAITGLRPTNATELSNFLRTPGQGTTTMIEDSEISKFSAERQATIRQSIDQMVANGHNANHLMLTKDGTVLLDREAVNFDNEMQALKGLKKD